MSFRFGADSTANSRVTRTGGAPDPQGAGGWTMCGWFYLSVDRNDFSTMFRAHASSGSTTRLTLATKTDGTSPAIFTPGNTGGVAGVDVFTGGAWLFIAIVQSGTTATIYTCTPGGTMHSASGTSSGGSAPDGYTIGGRSSSDSTEYFSGRARCVRQWSGVQLTSTELAAERDSFTAVKTGTYSDHPLATGTDLSDASGNSRTLTAGSVSGTTEADPPIGTSFTDAGTATLTLGASGTQGRTAAAAGTADAALAATGTSTAVRAGSGTAAMALGAAGTTQALRAAAGTADALLSASGTATHLTGDAGASTSQLGASGTATRTTADAGTSALQLGASGAAARQAADAGTAVLTLAAAGAALHLATAIGAADLAVQATGTVDSGSDQQSGTAVLILDATGAHSAIRAAAGAAVLTLDASGTGQPVLPILDSGTATLLLDASGPSAAIRTAAGDAVMQLAATGVVFGEQRDITVTAVLLPSRFSARLLPSRWHVQEAS
ncbi:hypothetical protein [Amycolatopsis sp. cmx-4-83]|uniref:hypothetical protein n=1 Tax=Amycolatopsis sp. cmx-4-83 TaxID=2790940 RepID=UPI00397A6247